ncbi:MAG TPA: class I SAM-dependent methyltransferase [Anaerolineales bacterium]|nr:class I SAM-dependent methyltransferase [Anaerolineales bacterium]
MKNQPIDYDRIADLYDAYVKATYDVDFFVEEAQKAGGPVLELMAGTGRLSIPLLEAGVRLTCVDLSPMMLQKLRQKLDDRSLEAEIYEMDVRALSLPHTYQLILLPFNSFGELVSDEDQRHTLERIYSHLEAGGRFICTLHNPGLRRQRADGVVRLWDKFPMGEGEGDLVLMGVETYNNESGDVQGLQFYEHYDSQGVLQSKRLLATNFNLLTRERFDEMASAAGFTSQALYGDYQRADFDVENSPYMIWVLEK